MKRMKKKRTEGQNEAFLKARQKMQENAER